MREFWNQFPRDYLAQADVLQFSDDPALDPVWCPKLEVSIFGGRNSLDLQKIDREDASYDIVIANQVLEHVPDDKSSLRELLRITRSDGCIQLSVPSPMTLKQTEDWGYPRKEEHGHYRNYGADIGELFDQIVGVGNHCECIVTDPVTGEEDCIFLLCHSSDALAMITDRLDTRSVLREPR